MVKITQQFIDSGKSVAGAWSRYQLGLLGVSWPPKVGWRRRIEGSEISDAAAAEFIKAKDYSRLRKLKNPRARKVRAREELAHITRFLE